MKPPGVVTFMLSLLADEPSAGSLVLITHKNQMRWRVVIYCQIKIGMIENSIMFESGLSL